jgi:cysteine synthase A
MDLGADDIVMTVATDGASMYQTELLIAENKLFDGKFSEVEAAETFGRHVLGLGIDHMTELGRFNRERVFNLGYYTWVEQQGVSLADFDQRRDQSFWDNLMNLVPVWDQMIDRFNAGG